MMPKIDKILYATDLSQSAALALRYAMLLGEKFDAKVTLLHVVETVSHEARLAFYEACIDGDTQKQMSKTKKTEATAAMEQRLESYCREELPDDAEACFSKVKIDICQGYPEEQILSKADKYDVDVIVMGTHEKGFAHTFLGSVAKRVLRRSRKPVFIVPLPEL
ncbi:universal stress protein [Desulforhopalus singaporensis]|uniref:Nucleotide-binding universal stress protein, UspA family n=1 Tax=Desulforhopalus singaporensis TaxID=91360 RepID=A0A1H0TBA3_9BACT|nr:universal stress protein [Desulforhopalus singaporensis]SDP51307.1 Nucleotide-binding universal stress protein, UspA family [Desulforhopalus singaporensis]